MRLHHPLFVAACALPLLACGGGSDNDNGDVDVVPEGTHYGYVVSKATVVPDSSQTPNDLGLDLGTKTSAKRDGKVDNKLGAALTGLAGLFNVQPAVDTAISHGTLILLVDLQTTDFTNNVKGAAIAVKFGTNPNPLACTDANDTVCGHHLTGSASFSVDPTGPQDASLEGQVVNGTFKSNAGDISLKLTLGTPTPVQLDLHHARAQASGMSDAKVTTLIVGGLLTVDDLKTKIGPVIKAQVDSILSTCTGTGAGCGCTGSAATAQKVLDTDGNCMVTVDEIFASQAVAPLLEPDSCSKDSCSAPDALSLGIRVEAVKAKF